MQNGKYEVPSWDRIYDMLLRLSLKIRQSGYRPEVIVGVSRGGWPPARILSDLLANPTLANMKVEFYTDISKTVRRPRITQPVTAIVRGRKVLVVDDVSDTGHSLKVVVGHLRKRGAKEIKVCTIYMKPHSIYEPDYYAKRTRKWIIFPWERYEAINLIGNKIDGQNKTMTLIRDLQNSGFDSRLIRRLARMVKENEART